MLASWAGGLLVVVPDDQPRPSRARHDARLADDRLQHRAGGARLDRVRAAARLHGPRAATSPAALKEAGPTGCGTASPLVGGKGPRRGPGRAGAGPPVRRGALRPQPRARFSAQDTGIDGRAAPRRRRRMPRPPATRGTRSGQFDLQVLDRLRAVPAVEAAALSWMPPISNTMGNWTQSIMVDGVPPRGGALRLLQRRVARVLRHGRHAASSAAATSRTRTSRHPRRSSSSTKRWRGTYFPGADPIGHRITIGKAASRQNLEIVGVVQDAKYRTLQEPARSIAYLSIAQVEDVTLGTRICSRRFARRISRPRRPPRARSVRAIDPRVPVHVETVADRIRESTLTERLIAVLAAALGVAALILACAGLYGLLAYAVSRHGREIGLRIALGARPASVLWMVQRESLVLAAIGIVAGLGGALALGRFVRTMLFQVTPADPARAGRGQPVMLAVASGGRVSSRPGAPRGRSRRRAETGVIPPQGGSSVGADDSLLWARHDARPELTRPALLRDSRADDRPGAAGDDHPGRQAARRPRRQPAGRRRPDRRRDGSSASARRAGR